MNNLCIYCDQTFNLKDKKKGWMANHVRWCSKNPKRNDYLSALEKTREKVTSEHRKIQGEKIKGRACSEETKDRIAKSHIGIYPSQVTRDKISSSMKKAFEEGRLVGWQQSNRNHKSYPEKLFKIFAERKGLFTSYSIEDQYSFNGYFFDYAIPNLKIDIEIDGSQHYRTNEATEYDKKRDEVALNLGWRVYRISAKELKDNPSLELDKLIEFIESSENYRCYSIGKLKEHFKI